MCTIAHTYPVSPYSMNHATVTVTVKENVLFEAVLLPVAASVQRSGVEGVGTLSTVCSVALLALNQRQGPTRHEDCTHAVMPYRKTSSA
jgi:hypothetical protein